MAGLPNAGIFGDNVEIRVFIDGQPQPGLEFANSIKIKQDSTIHKRNHLGRKRQRVAKQVDGYTIDLSLDVTDTQLLDKLRDRDDKRDANLLVPELTIAFKFTLRTGVEVMYMATGCEDSTDIDAGDRNQEVGFNVQITAEDVEKVA